MPESDSPKRKGAKPQNKPKSFFSLGFWLVVLLAVGLGSFLYWLSFRSADPIDTHWQFFVASLLNALIFIAVVFQAFIYQKQWDTMERQLRLMAIGASAYVAVDTFQPPIVSNDAIRVEGKLFNRGQTPAFELEQKIQIALGEGIPPKGWGRFDWDAAPGDPEPDLIPAQSNVNIGRTLHNVSAEDIAKVRNGRLLLSVDGQCRYLDNLGERQIYTFGLTFELDPLRPYVRYQNYRREETETDNPN